MKNLNIQPAQVLYALNRQFCVKLNGQPCGVRGGGPRIVPMRSASL